MDFSGIEQAFAANTLDQKHRPILLRWGSDRKLLEQVLVVQRIDVTEGLCAGIEGHLTCLSTRVDLPPNAFLGLPVSLQLVTDTGGLQAINGIVTDVRVGQSDGSLACYQLTLRDALAVLEKRVNTRIFRTLGVPDIIDTLLKEWRERSPALAKAFDFDLSGVESSQYPKRETTLQYNESDANFIRRLCRREGIAWFVRAGKQNETAAAGDDSPVHTLVFCDATMKSSPAGAGTVRYHRDAATEERDAITLWSARCSLFPGSVRRSSWDYKTGKMTLSELPGLTNQGETGNDIAHLLSDSVIDPPHAGDSWGDHERLSKLRMLAHELRAESIQGEGGVRNMPVGHWFQLTGHPTVDTQPAEQQQFVVIALHHRAENNFPKDINQRAQMLFASSRWKFEGFGSRESGNDTGTRYENSFTCVRRGVPLTPMYEPRIDLPLMHPITARVVGPEGEEVFCDELGRIKIQLQGLNADDHEHAHGAGTSDSDRDSAFVRVSSALAGKHFGHDTLPRIGMEVVVDFLAGDPDKMLVTGVVHSGPNMPATFSHTGNLPGNRYLSGVKTKEIKGGRYNQLRFDDTPGEISSQLASEDAYSQLNLGHLTHPREDGKAQTRGAGAELRSDAHVAIRSGHALLLSAWQRLGASDNQLSRDETLHLMEECFKLFKSLGDYAAQHQGVAMDTSAQNTLVDIVKGWHDNKVPASDAPSADAAIALGAPAGISLATPKTIAIHAGDNIDAVATENFQVAAGQQINMSAGQGVSLFAFKAGLSAIANQGPVRVQSQADDTRIDSAKNILMTAADGKLSGMANDEIVFVTSGGAYLKLKGSNIELGCPGSFIVKAASHTWAGPASMSTDMPSFDHGTLGRKLQLVRASDGEAAKGFLAEVRLASGEVRTGETNDTGELPPVSSDQFEKLVVDFFVSKD